LPLANDIDACKREARDFVDRLIFTKKVIDFLGGPTMVEGDIWISNSKEEQRQGAGEAWYGGVTNCGQHCEQCVALTAEVFRDWGIGGGATYSLRPAAYRDDTLFSNEIGQADSWNVVAISKPKLFLSADDDPPVVYALLANGLIEAIELNPRLFDQWCSDISEGKPGAWFLFGKDFSIKNRVLFRLRSDKREFETEQFQ
jgi:hypothetical protein